MDFWAALISNGEFLTLVIAALLLVVAWMRAGVTSQEAAAETRMARAEGEALFNSWASDFQQDNRAMQAQIDQMQRVQGRQQIIIIKLQAENNRLQRILKTERSIYALREKIMSQENEKLRQQVRALGEQVAELTERVADLEQERGRRIQAEQERDAMRTERDNLLARVSQLQGQVDEQAREIEVMAARLRKLDLGEE